MNSNAHFNTIAELDLDPIKVKLMHKESGEGWTLEQANAVEFEYRRFLCLMKLFPHEQTAPLFDVDIFWHYHILDTMKYAADCERVFGYFLHHFPYVGLRGEDDEVTHQQVGVRMQELYESTFGEAYFRKQEGSGLTGIDGSATVAASDEAADSADVTARIASTAYSVATIQSNSAHSVRPALHITETAHTIPAARNDSVYSVQLASNTRKTAYSVAAVQSDLVSSARPGFGTSNTAYSVAAVQSDRVYSARPGFGTTKTAYSVAAVQSDPVYSARPGFGTTKTAYSVAAVQNDSVHSARPGLATSKTAYSVAAVRCDGFSSIRPMLANAA
jgi:hypothetical protein